MTSPSSLSVTQPTRPMTKIPTITLSVRDICCAKRIMWPRPVDATTISAPMMARQE